MDTPALRDDDTAAAAKIPPRGAPRHDDALIDQALQETFPASDPISPAVAARMQAAEDAAAAESARYEVPRWSQRLVRLMPTLIALGAIAIALGAMRGARAPRAR